MTHRGLLRLSLILAIFLAQWALFAHDYQDHEVGGQSCEICIGVNAISHALPASGPEVPSALSLGTLTPPTALVQPALAPRQRYHGRGPPAALS